LSDALRGDRPRLTAEIFQPAGNSILLFDDGSTFDHKAEARKHGG
jgi:hypothetical protein